MKKPPGYDANVAEMERISDEEIARGDYAPVPNVYPCFLPGAWQTKIRDEMRAAYFNRDTKTFCAISTARERDGRRWLHVSVSNPGRLPTYAELVEIKNGLIGRGRMAYQIFAPDTEHVNFHSRCLHLWSCLDGDGPGGAVTPDFRKGGSV